MRYDSTTPPKGGQQEHTTESDENHDPDQVAVPVGAADHARDFAVSLDRCVVFDLEVYPGRWLVGFHGRGRDGSMTNLVVDGDRDRLRDVLDTLAGRGITLAGYNSDRFDVPLIRAILKGLDPYALAQSIISKGRMPIPVASLPVLVCDHLDLSARLKRGGNFPSLKLVAANLGRPMLQELPYDPGTILTDDQWAEVGRYNEIDLGHTWALLERFVPELEALASLSAELGQDLRSVPTPRVVEDVFLAAHRRQHGADPARPEPPHEVVFRPDARVARPRTPEAAAWYDQVTNRPMRLVAAGDDRKVDVPRAHFKIGDLMLSVGAGGLHSDDKPDVHYATREHRLIEADVASFYPSVIAKFGIGPRAYGTTGAVTFRDILDRRLAVKRQAKVTEDPAERQRLEVQATALKLVINSFFGKLGSPHSSLYDPSAMLAVTLSGQLMLIDLIERLTEVGARIVSTNTDAVFFKVRRKDGRWKTVVTEWQRDTAMTLEVESLKRLVILATNAFATLDLKGRIKRRGAELKGDFTPTAAPNALVVSDAVAGALLRDEPPERTVWRCDEPARFCRVTRRSSNVVAAVLFDEGTGRETELGKIARSYKAKGSNGRIIHRLNAGRQTTPANAVGIALAMDLTGPGLPRDLDLGWYIGQARRIIQKVRSYRHRSPRRLEGNEAATDLLERGLLPCPKWAGKAVPPGSDPRVPTLLWDWSRCQTLGTYTGPATGILVVDVDDSSKFRLWIDRGNSPLLASRWRDFDGCMVSVHGDVEAGDVRSGRARGKLIFRFDADDQHPLARLSAGHWGKGRGIDVFYGGGIPSVVGEHPSGERYRIEGGLTDAPEWLIDGLKPRAGSRPKVGANGRVRPIPGATTSPADGQPDGLDHAVTPEILDGLRRELAELAPELGRWSIGWRTKELPDTRLILVGRCPFPHDSGTGNDADLSCGFNEAGEPYIHCLHSSCGSVPMIDRALKSRYVRDNADVIAVPTLEPTAMALSFVEDLRARRISLNRSPTGSGKSHSICQAAVMRYRAGDPTLIAVPTRRLAKEVAERLAEMAPDAVAAGAIAHICGHKRSPLDGVIEPDDEDDGDANEGAYPIDAGTRIVVCTHAQLGRRGFSRFLRAIWSSIEAGGDDRPGYALIIDEVGELIRQARWSIDLAHRFQTRHHPDGSGGLQVSLRDCPRGNWSGNCGNCTRELRGGETRFNTYKIRELGPPRAIETDAAGERLRQPRAPIKVDAADFSLGDKIHIGLSVFASPVLGYRDQPVAENTRRTAPLYLFKQGKKGEQEPETTEDILSHQMLFACRPVVVWEHPVDEAGGIVSSDTLAFRIEKKDAQWDHGIIFPRQTCEVPRLLFTDTVGLEQARRFAARNNVGIVFAGASLTDDDTRVLMEVWPDMVHREHPYPNRKIRRAAVVFLEDRHGLDVMVGDDERLLTIPLETFGFGLMFCPTRRLAETFFKRVNEVNPSVRLAVENYEETVVRRGLHDDEGVKSYITYSRGVLGLGANLENVRFVVVDALSFRWIASFNPSEVTPEAFAQARAQERVSLMLQNVGRALRGEEGKTVVIIILNADKDIKSELRVSPALIEGAELPPVFAQGGDIVTLIDQARRWLEAGGGEWPEPDPDKKTTKQKGRPKGSTKKTPESILAAADDAIKAGTKWREFRSKERPDRTLKPEEMEALKARFGVVRDLPC